MQHDSVDARAGGSRQTRCILGEKVEETRARSVVRIAQADRTIGGSRIREMGRTRRSDRGKSVSDVERLEVLKAMRKMRTWEILAPWCSIEMTLMVPT